MIRPYNYSFSRIQKVQSFINHVMLDVVFNARNITEATFSSALTLPKYRDLIDKINDQYIQKPLSDAFLICKNLSSKNIKLLKTAVHNNNKIRELCNGSIQPVKYEQIEAIDATLKVAIKTFCDHLYDHCIKLEPFYNTYENINEYYKKVVKRSSFCRCCGINKVLTQFHTHRSALDHYLPRKYYPFNSLNFKNLIPICDTCNSKYKLSEDTLYITQNKGKRDETQKRTIVFYPYSKIAHDIQIHINLTKDYSYSIEPEDIEINLLCAGNDEKVDSWNRIFGIKENYKAECCTDEMRMYYEEQYVAEMNYGKTHQEYVDMLRKNKYGDVNFLKIPFLEAINRQYNP